MRELRLSNMTSLSPFTPPWHSGSPWAAGLVYEVGTLGNLGGGTFPVFQATISDIVCRLLKSKGGRCSLEACSPCPCSGWWGWQLVQAGSSFRFCRPVRCSVLSLGWPMQPVPIGCCAQQESRTAGLWGPSGAFPNSIFSRESC